MVKSENRILRSIKKKTHKKNLGKIDFLGFFMNLKSCTQKQEIHASLLTVTAYNMFYEWDSLTYTVRSKSKICTEYTIC